MKDKKTTAAGIVAALCAFGLFVVVPLIDGVDATTPKWDLFITTALTSLGLGLASDSKPQPPAPPAPPAPSA